MGEGSDHYGRFCPVSMGTQVLADRWTPMIIRELMLGNTRFNEIARGLPGISRSLLVKRLRHLERTGVLDRWPTPSGRGGEYRLTPAGKGLEPIVMSLGRWAIEWLYDELDPHDVDAVTLAWWMHRRIDLTALPPERIVIQLDHTAPERTTLWLVLEHGAASVCLQHPGFETDVLITGATPAYGEVFSGHDTWASALKHGRLTMHGPTRLTRAVPRWFLNSPFFEDVRAAVTARG